MLFIPINLRTFSLALCIVASFLFSIEADFAYGRGINSEDDLQKIDHQKKNTFSVLGCVTWWSHDAVGYHPAMSLFLENTGGNQITGGEIPFQGRFTDVRTGEVTVAREYKRAPIRPNERICIFLRGPKYYELPIESASWPTIECKAMCRLNNANVEDLFIVHLAQVTMSDEDAQALLVSQAGRNPLLANNKTNSKTGIQLAELDDSKLNDGAELPLHASPNAIAKVKDKSAEVNQTGLKKNTNDNKKTYSFPKNLPSLGSDFYAFDRLFGDAIEVQPGRGSENLTWTRYKSDNLIKEVFVGSRDANKADMIIIVMNKVSNEKDLIAIAKILTNCRKGDPIAPFAHSVKYLANGRSEIMSTAFQENRILSFQTPNNLPAHTIIVASRLQGDLETLLSNYSRRVNFLKFLEPNFAY